MVGTGLVGGSIGLALRRAGWHVTGADHDTARAERALALGALDAVGSDPAASITFVATPVRAIADVARKALSEGIGVVTDVGSVKASVVDAVADERFVGGHPMAGSEQEGVDGADADLFEGAVWVLTPTAGTDDTAYATVRNAVTELGADVVSLSPEHHDALVAVVSHVPHLTAATLMGLADSRATEHRALLRLAAGGFRDMTRIAAGHPGIWPDICAENRSAIVEVLDGLVDSLRSIRDVVAAEDRDGLLRILDQARCGTRQPAGSGRPARGACRAAGAGAGPDRRAGRRDDLGGPARREHRRPGDRPLQRGRAGRAHHGHRGRGGRALPPGAGRAWLPAGGAGAGVTSLEELPDPLLIEPIDGPLDAVVVVPGSKSITNRALVTAALATGTSHLHGVLRADDTEAMIGGLGELGVPVRADWSNAVVDVGGVAGRPPADVAAVDARLSGTTSRFLLPVAALGRGTYRVDGAAPLRARPMGTMVGALRALGVTVTESGAPQRLPVDVSGGPVRGGEVELPGDVSSQFLSGLLLAGPSMAEGLTVRVATALVPRPYVDLTLAVMRSFGASVEEDGTGMWRVAPIGYQAATYPVEPDASAASYFFGAAAIVGGRVTVEGLGTESRQGDVAFVDLLERMGADVERRAGSITVSRSGVLHGIDADLADLSDTAQTLAAVAVFAEGPTRMTGIGFIRGKETDRIGNVVTELRRCGIEADEESDGMVVHPGRPQPAIIETYHDHRMAMSFALLGLRAEAIRIADPACVAKTFPGYWDTLARLHGEPTTRFLDS